LVVEGKKPNCIQKRLLKVYGEVVDVSTLHWWVRHLKEAETGQIGLAWGTVEWWPLQCRNALKTSAKLIRWNCDYWRVWLFQGMWLLGAITTDRYTQTGKAISRDWDFAPYDNRSWGLPITNYQSGRNPDASFRSVVQVAVSGKCHTMSPRKKKN
jgi:hypothetical protein